MPINLITSGIQTTDCINVIIFRLSSVQKFNAKRIVDENDMVSNINLTGNTGTVKSTPTDLSHGSVTHSIPAMMANKKYCPQLQVIAGRGRVTDASRKVDCQVGNDSVF